MTVIENAKVLAMAPEIWEIKLDGGAVLRVLAHAYHVEQADAVFSLLFSGTPNFFVEVLRLPLALLPPDFS